MRKLIAKIIILITLITFIIPKYSFATESNVSETANPKDSPEYKAYTNLKDKGTANVNGRQEQVIDTFTAGDAIATPLAFVSTGIAEAIRVVITEFVKDGVDKDVGRITVAGLLSGEYPVLNNDYLLSKDTRSDINNSVNKQVAVWYYAIRNLAVVLSLLVLIYVGIRMAISTLAEDKAKYKKMLMGWIQSFILIFLLHYVMIIAMGLQKSMIELIQHVGKIDGSIERKILGDSLYTICVSSGMKIIEGAILYCVLTYYQVKFFLLYAKRMLATAFLMIIAPLITVTYSIDKIGDNKAQAYKNWIKEFLVNVFIQPLHLLIYLVFIVSASEIAVKMPLFTVIFFGGLSRGEKIIKGVFGMRGMKSINSLGVRRKRR